ncbi:MAG: hypothetical protein IJZ34_13175 [Lachnospiraceae bacterium]|nr:hypothetical protein [Lachnospiraceae bacterium]
MKKRKDSFWGIHCDIHVKPEFGVLGANLKEDEIREVLRLLKPDYVQIDCKGHFGWASYPSELGNGAPEFACDPLEVFRRITKEEGVALYLHYSGVWDSKYCSEHPEERVVNADGSVEPRMEREDLALVDATRTNGRYVDDLLIPQLMELAGKYGCDGVWVDGECWAIRPDFHPDTLKAFQEETGYDLRGQIPASPGDVYYQEYREYIRELFRRYMRHYVDVVHEKYPDFQITSNWMYSDMVPEKVTVNLDFLSGDLDGVNSLNGGRFAGRAIVQQGLPWDLMAWGDRGFWKGHLDMTHKHPVQLMQEAAVVISLGGGFQEIVSQRPDLSWDIPRLKELVPLMEFVRAREAYCFKGKFIHQAAVLLSTHDKYLEGGDLLGRGNADSKMGVTSLLCDIGQSVEIVSEHTLTGNCNQYQMIVVPEIQNELAKETIEELLEYAEEGGNLVLLGTKTCKVFSEFGAPYKVGVVRDEILPVRRMCHVNGLNDQRYFTLNDQQYGCVFAPSEIQAAHGEVIANTCYTKVSTKHPLAVMMDFGKGKIVAVGADFGTFYRKEPQYLHRTLMRVIVDKLYTPKAKLESATGLLELVCLEKNGRLMLQMINANGSHDNINSWTNDHIPPVLDIKLSVACDTKPKKILLQPGNKEIDFEYQDKRAYLEIDRIDIHNVLEFV